MKALLLFLFAFAPQITTKKVAVVQTCPETKTAWDHRSSLFACEDGNMKYHCVMRSMENLVEVCITPLNIKGNEKGCPMVYIFESAPFWEFPFTPCPVQNTECPQDGHGGYSSEQLYRYPSCFRNISERTPGNNDFGQTTIGTRISTDNSHMEEARKLDLEYLPYTIAVMFLLLASLLVFAILLYWKIRKVEVMIQERRKRISQISSISRDIVTDLKESDDSPLPVYDSRTRTRSVLYEDSNAYTSFRKKDLKGSDNIPLPVLHSMKSSTTTSNYEDNVYENHTPEKDLKGSGNTPLPVLYSKKGTTTTTNYEDNVYENHTPEQSDV